MKRESFVCTLCLPGDGGSFLFSHFLLFWPLSLLHELMPLRYIYRRPILPSIVSFRRYSLAIWCSFATDRLCPSSAVWTRWREGFSPPPQQFCSAIFFFLLKRMVKMKCVDRAKREEEEMELWKPLVECFSGCS